MDGLRQYQVFIENRHSSDIIRAGDRNELNMLKEERHMEKYKVILVDDEVEAIQAMEHKMDWDGAGL